MSCSQSITAESKSRWRCLKLFLTDSHTFCLWTYNEWRNVELDGEVVMEPTDVSQRSHDVSPCHEVTRLSERGQQSSLGLWVLKVRPRTTHQYALRQIRSTQAMKPTKRMALIM